MPAELFDSWLLYTTIALIPIVTLSTLRINAPYGRHARKGWGPTLPSRVGWVLMESPSAFLFPVVVATSPRGDRWMVWLLATLWLAHYFERTLVYPFRQRGQQDKRVPLVVVSMGFLFNILNSTLNGRSLGAFGPDYDAAWLTRPTFWAGVVLFAVGFITNRWADSVLRKLRSNGQTGYRIPFGGLYDHVSCPNYLGELVEWTGWAVATWSLAGAAFAAFTAANLVPRALAHHRWYRSEFPDYPPARKAIIPGLL